MPSRITNNISPITRPLNKNTDYSFLRTFGCACCPSLRKYNSHKLEFRSKLCVFVGYSSLHKGYKCRDRSTCRIYISLDVIFDETKFPFALSTTQIVPSTMSKLVSFLSNELGITNDHIGYYDLSLLSNDVPVAAAPQQSMPNVVSSEMMPPIASVNHQPQPNISSTDSTSACVNEAPSLSPSSVDLESPSFPINVSTPAPVNMSIQLRLHLWHHPHCYLLAMLFSDPSSTDLGMLTRGHAGKSFPRKFSDGTVLYDPKKCAFLVEPKSYKLALTEPA